MFVLAKKDLIMARMKRQAHLVERLAVAEEAAEVIPPLLPVDPPLTALLEKMQALLDAGVAAGRSAALATPELNSELERLRLQLVELQRKRRFEMLPQFDSRGVIVKITIREL